MDGGSSTAATQRGRGWVSLVLFISVLFSLKDLQPHVDSPQQGDCELHGSTYIVHHFCCVTIMISFQLIWISISCFWEKQPINALLFLGVMKP